MNDYAVIKIKGIQYKVSKGEEILIPGTCDEKVKTETLLRVNDDKVSIGKPSITKLSCKLKVITEGVRGEKINVLKYKAKSRYRKRIGFRSISTKLLVEKID
jgi:large subunit ribosomal protein L21